MYLLPQSIPPHNSVDTMDQRYLNFSHAPIVSPLKKSLQIELYNYTYFHSNSKYISKPSLDQPSSYIGESSFLLHPDIPSATSLFDECKIKPPPKEIADITPFIPPIVDPLELPNALFLSVIHLQTPCT